MKRLLILGAGVVATTLLAGRAHAAPPANDNFVDAQALTGESGTVTGTNVDATREEGEEDLSINSYATVWYKWTAEKDGYAAFDTFGSRFDTYLAVFTGTELADLEEIARNDDANGSEYDESRAVFEIAAGTTYYILAGGYSDSRGTLTLNWDLMDGAFKILSTNGKVTGYIGELPAALTATDWPDGVTAIGYGAFEGCETLETVTLPASVTAIEDNPFYGCPALAAIAVADGSTAYAATDGVLYTKDGTTLVAYPRGRDAQTFTIPDGVTTIGRNAFYRNDNLTSVTIPATVQTIEDYAFSSCYELGEVTFRGDIAKVNMSLGQAFAETPWLENLELDTPANDNFADAIELTGEEGRVEGTTLGATREEDDPADYSNSVWYKWTAPADGAVRFDADLHGIQVFTGDSLETLSQVGYTTAKVEAGKTYFIALSSWRSYGAPFALDWVFGDGSFKLVIRDGILKGVLGECPAEVVVPDGVTELGESAFDSDSNESATNLVRVTLPEGLKTVGEYAFWGCTSLESIVLPSTVTQVGEYAFEECASLASATLNEGLEKIEEGLFCSCASLRSLTIPSTVTAIRYNGDFFGAVGGTVSVLAPRSLENDIWSDEFENGIGHDEYDEDMDLWKWVVDSIVTTKVEVVYYTPVVMKTDDGETLHYAVGDTYGTLPEITTGHGRAVTWVASDGSVVTADTAIQAGESLTAVFESVNAFYPEDDGEVAANAASVYNGYVIDADFNNVGTVQVKVGKANARTRLSSVSAVVQLTGQKKVTLKARDRGKAEIATNGVTRVTFGADGSAMTLDIAEDRLTGVYGDYTVQGARNLFTAKDAESKAQAAAILANWRQPVNVVWGEGSVSVAVAAKGKAKVAGTVGGRKVSANAQMIAGAEWCCVPVSYAKGGVSFEFMLWLSVDGATAEVEGDGFEDALVGKPGTLAADAAFRFAEGAKEAFVAALGDATFAAYLPDGNVSVALNANKFVVANGAKAGKVAYDRSGKVDEAKAGANPSALKLTYVAKTGSFKGTFKAYTLVRGKPKAVSVAVAGVMVDGVGYGTATAKGHSPVAITLQ